MRTLDQSLSEAIINQSNYLITFDTQLKTALIIIIIIIMFQFKARLGSCSEFAS